MSKPKVRREVDMTQGALWSKILILALPLAVTAMLQQLFNAADVAVVGRFVPDPDVAQAAMAAVGSNAPIVNLLVNLFVGISLGSNVLIAQSIGRGDREEIRKTVHTSVLLSILGGIAIGAGGQLVVTPLLHIMDVPADVFALSSMYLRIYLVGMPVILLYNFEAAILRSVGDTRTPLLVLTVSGVVNVGLNVFFVLVLNRTVDGVAIATVVSNALSAVILLILLCRGRGDVRVNLRELRIYGDSLERMLRIGIPAGLQGMVFSISNICVQSAINSLGRLVMAASSAAFNLEIFTFVIVNSFGQACTTVVGQNYGAGRLDRCRRTLWVTIGTCAVFYTITAVLLLVFSEQLLSLFNEDPQVIALGVIRMRYIITAQCFALIIENLSGYLRGYGLSMAPALSSLIFSCGTRIIWVYLIFPRNPTFETIMTVYPVSLCLTAIVIVLYCVFNRKRFRQNPPAPARES